MGGILLDKIGRRHSIILISIPRLCMAIILIFADKVWIFITCRTIMLVVDCFMVVTIPIYASEIACVSMTMFFLHLEILGGRNQATLYLVIRARKYNYSVGPVYACVDSDTIV